MLLTFQPFTWIYKAQSILFHRFWTQLDDSEFVATESNNNNNNNEKQKNNHVKAPSLISFRRFTFAIKFNDNKSFTEKPVLEPFANIYLELN